MVEERGQARDDHPRDGREGAQHPLVAASPAEAVGGADGGRQQPRQPTQRRDEQQRGMVGATIARASSRAAGPTAMVPLAIIVSR